MNPIQILKDNGYKPNSDLNYCTDNGIEYYVGRKGDNAAVAAAIYDESIYFITKAELNEMSETAKEFGVKKVTLFTNYGIELHSKFEKPQLVGFDRIEKIISTF